MITLIPLKNNQKIFKQFKNKKSRVLYHVLYIEPQT